MPAAALSGTRESTRPRRRARPPGLTVATIVGVPLANGLGQIAGWRWCFGIVAALALATAILVASVRPEVPRDRAASPSRELGALKRGQVWLTLAIGAIGFGGCFRGIYLSRLHLDGSDRRYRWRMVPMVFAAFGLRNDCREHHRSLLCRPRGDENGRLAVAGLGRGLALYPVAAPRLGTVTLDVMAIGFCAALATVLQTRLMDVPAMVKASQRHSTTLLSMLRTHWDLGLAAWQLPLVSAGLQLDGWDVASHSGASSVGHRFDGRP